jgi:hypothetical protein
VIVPHRTAAGWRPGSEFHFANGRDAQRFIREFLYHDPPPYPAAAEEVY